MYSDLITTVSKKLAERWVTTLFAPAFIFWLGGAVAMVQRYGWRQSEAWLAGLEDTLQIGVLFTALLVVLASGAVVQRFDRAILRFFEGYWPPWSAPLRNYLLQRQRRWFDRMEDRWNELMAKQDGQPQAVTPQELEESIELDMQLRQVPSLRSRQMPLRLGNILRAAETRPKDKYGLDAVVCWPRLWMLLPEEIKQSISEARSELNTAARIWLWGVLFLVWFVVGGWSWWALLVGLGTAWFAHRWMLLAATTYGELLEAAFDLYRFKLYEALRWPLPQNPAEEQHSGELLTAYLWRGLRTASLQFTISGES
ncbi:MAG: hypothetical protein AAF289_17340 [Cyanobacteria bacterium P01_A01_bin.135]